MSAEPRFTEAEVRARLLSNEAHEAALDAQIRMSGRASDRATEAAIAAALDVAFSQPPTPTSEERR